MLKKVLVVSLLMLFAFQGSAFAYESGGDVVFQDAMYGALLGGILGMAIYATDDSHFSQKVGIGVAIGAIAGIAYGVMETQQSSRSIVEYKGGDFKFAAPQINTIVMPGETVYSTSFLNVRF